MTDLISKGKVVLASAVTWLVLASTLVTLIAAELVTVLPEQSQTISALAVRVTAWLAAAITIIRRVTPVDAQDRGIR